ncbi:MAG: hypothetical protein JWM68_992, partial [Verrucomicrobiales bacterium]|nr:hypothetical protein [Verrucomicrobiales bacterium]
MKTNKLTMLFSLVLAISGIALQGVEIVRDNYTATNVNAGFALGNGVNSGINPQGTPPFTRITGTSAANLRYLYTQTGTAKSTNSFTIGNGLTANTNRLKVAGSGSSGRFTLSANGTAPFDFAPALGVPNASPTNPSIYEIQITMDNDTPTANGNARFSLGFATAEIDANNWDFGIQLYRIGTADLNYTVQKRINSLSHGFPSPTNINSPIITGGVAGAFGTEVTFRIHVTDAGPESGTNYNSRIEVYIIGASATNLIYDTQASAEVANKWRLDGPGRFISWDIAGNTVATYDNFAVTLISAPSVSQTVWNGGGGDDNWSTGDNWGGVPPITGNSLIFNGTTRQVNVNDIADLIAPSVTFSNGGFALSGLPWTLTTSIANLAGTNTFGGDLSWSTTFPKSWNVASGSEVLLTNLNTVGVNGDHTLSGGGTVHLKGTMNIGQASAATPAIKIDEGKYIVDGGIFASQGNYSVGSLPTGAGAQLILTNGASFTLSSTNTLRVGDSANPITAQLNIDNSTITMGNAILAIPYAAGATSIVNQVGGTVSSASVAFCNGGVGKGTYNIKDGTLETKQIREDSN